MRKSFPVVCIGGSAGGLEAYVRILKNLPFETGVAIVIVNHVSRNPTTLHKYLTRHTQMPVELITTNLKVKPNHVFIMRISEERDSDFAKSRTVVSLIPGQVDGISFRLSCENHWLKIY